MCIAGRTKKVYYRDNKDKIKKYKLENKENAKEYMKEYYEDNKEKAKGYYEENKEKISEQGKVKITCVCGSCYRKEDKSTHEKTHKHQSYLKFIE
jgi:hypothetical protein